MAAYTWVGLLSDNWSTPGNWSASPPSVTVPGTGDTVVINNTQPCRVTAASNCLTIDFTGYTSTFTINSGFTLQVFGTIITLGAGMTFTPGTTGVLSLTGNVVLTTITFAGIIIPNLTIARPFGGSTAISGTTPTVKNLVIAGAGVSTLTGTSLVITSSVILNQRLDGVVPMIFTGTVTLSGTNGLRTGFTVPTGSTLIIGSNIIIGGNVTFAAGSNLTPGLFTVTIASSCTLDSNVVTWYDISLSNATTTSVTLTSNWIISNNLFINSFASSNVITSAIVRTVTVQGSVTSNVSYSTAFQLNNITLNLTGRGTFAVARTTQSTGVSTININTTDPVGYVIGNATFTGANVISLGTLSFNLVGTSVATAFVGTSLFLNGTTINTNRFADTIGGSNPIYTNIEINLGTATFITDTTCTGNLVFTTTVSGAAANGAKILFGGNLVGSTLFTVFGTSTLEFTGSNPATWGAGTYQNNIVVNKSSGAVVTAAAGNITWGLANRTLTMNSTVNFSANSNTFTLSTTPLTINDTFGNSFYNVNISAIQLNVTGGLMRINNNLTLTAAGATFAGAFGWDCNNLICSTAGTFNIILQQGITYRTRIGVSITGGLATTARPTMRSSLASSYAIWTLDFGATQSLIYVNATDIDSSGGQTIWSFGVLPLTNLLRTINWNPGVPLRTVAYTFVT